MNTRGQESPMDFQWENSSGRIDPNSPFRMGSARVAAAQETPVKKGVFHQPSSTKPTPFQTPFQTTFQTPATNNLFGGFSTPGTSKPPANPVYRQPSFTQPRFNDDLKSALPDLASPIDGGNDTESEAPTPDQLAYEVRRRGYQAAPTPTRTTGRGEIPRGRNTEKRITKARRFNSRGRRSRDYDRSGFYSDEDESGNDTDYMRPRRRIAERTTVNTYDGGWASQHRDIPEILSKYAGLFLRISLGLLLLYCVYNIVQAARSDIHQKIKVYSGDVAREISRCTFEHIQNRCAPDTIVPAMQQRCDNWERCMNQDPNKISWTKVGAETAAEVANSFFNNISIKTMVFTAIVVLGCLFYIISGPGYKSPPPQPLHPYAHIPNFQPEPSWAHTPHSSPSKQLPLMWQTPMPMPETPTRVSRPKVGHDAGTMKGIEWN